MEVSSQPQAFEAKIKGIRFALATRQEICKASISDCPISHASQLTNPFLGLPLETGKCESCGTGEAGQCEGHFGYIELPTPIYHPDHVGELKRMLSLLCLKCLKFKNRKGKSIGAIDRIIACCEEASQISIDEAKTTDGAYYLELKIPKSKPLHGSWNFLEKYGFRYGDTYSRTLLASEVMVILRKIPKETRKKLSARGYFSQDGYILQHLPVPPNCLSVPDVSDGISTMSTDYSITLLKKVLRQVEIIKNSRSGMPNFESQEIEANDLQTAVAQYLEFRGTGKASRDVDGRYGVNKEGNASSTKAWLEKMKTLFIRKGSGFSSRSVITGDPFKGVSEIGLPFEIAQKITFEERVNQHNMVFLQKLVDEKLCLTYRDGQSTYSLREGSKGHTFLRPGQVVHRRIMDGDIVFINRPPTTHKHSLQALSVYIHDDHTVKINPLICGPLSADFDGDCIHLFYPQSLEAKAEVVELFSVEKQLLSSHTGNFNLQLATDSLLSLRMLFRKHFLGRAAAQQLAMFVPNMLSEPAVTKSKDGPLWTASQMLQMTFPPSFDCLGDKHRICRSELLFLDYNKDGMAPIVNEIVTSLFFLKGPKEVLRFFNSVQPLAMENLFTEGFSVSLKDFFLARDVLEDIQKEIQKIFPLLCDLRASYSESVVLQLENFLRSVKIPVTNFIRESSAIGHLVDSKSESALSKVVQQVGFLGIQVSDTGKLYSEALVKDMSALFQKKYPSFDDSPYEELGLVGRPLFRGLNPYQEMVHSISSREVIVRSSRGLTEPGTLFKNLMAILRDVVICYDGTVRNMCSNSIVQFEYGVNSANVASEFCAGDPVGVLAATAMSNPAYKAVLDSSPSSNSSWDMMKEILLCGVGFKNDVADRRVILYLNNCDCGRKHCQENAALIVKNHFTKITLKETAIEFLIEHRSQLVHESSDVNTGLVGHIHLNKTQLRESNISMLDILDKCQDTINRNRKKKNIGNLFKRIDLAFNECCSYCQSSKSKWTNVPCIQFIWQGTTSDLLERDSDLLVDKVYPVLIKTVVKGDPRVSSANLIWISPDTATWIRSPGKSPKGELALDITLEKEAVRKSGDAWRVVMDYCLPIFHLIDPHRSIPYAIKQVEDLLGISCAFEQSVQRLSTSVTMVTKGVLKDHLLLLGNSMTCAGTLIGFNTGGIKALSKSLGVQVPFMNATLFTPRKCFERAAEKCDVDNLSSIVGSCAWGKHVTVGTGSPFEIIWGTKNAETMADEEIDAYNFLRMVNSSKFEDTGTSCLGAEVDDLDDYMDFDLSPAREPGADKPTFEDGFEFGDDHDGLSKEDDGGWSSFSKKVDSENDGGWSSFGKKADSENDGGWSSFGKKADSENDGGWSSLGKKVDSDASHWGKKDEQSEWGKKDEQSTWGKQVDSGENGWAKKDDSNTWATDSSSKTPCAQSDWAAASSGGNDWGKKNEQSGNWDNANTSKTDSQCTWGKKTTQTDADFSGKSHNDGLWSAPSGAQRKAAGDEPSNASTRDKLGSGAEETTHTKSSGVWESSNDSQSNIWGSTQKQWNDSTPSQGWGARNVNTSNDKDAKPQWGGQKELNDWSAIQKQPKDSTTAQGWGASNVDASVDKDVQPQWGGKKESNNWSSSQKQLKDSSSAQGWGAANVDDSSGKDVQSQWGGKRDSQSDKWGSSQKQRKDSTSAQGWGASNVDASTQKDVNSQWGGQKESQSNDWSSSQKQTYDTAHTQGWDSLNVNNSSENDKSQWGAQKESEPSKWGSSQKSRNDSTPTQGLDTSGDKDEKSQWGAQKESEPNKWGSSQKSWNDATPSQGWGSQNIDTSGEKDEKSQWGGRGRGRGRGWGRGRGRGRSGEGSQGRGSSNDGEWKERRPRPLDDPNAPPLFTATRQRLDSFTAEEQDVLSAIEPVMKGIRRVMHQTGYNDGDKLSADDQTYVIDNVLNYHPDKAAKMGAGLDYIMVCRHKEFQDSRCFYAVSTDGVESDFSYRKCLENFIKEKYPDKAESFIPKYFKKPQPRPGWNRDRGPPRNEAGTPRWNSDLTSTPGPDEAGTPGWNRVQTPGPTPDEAGTPGWNSVQTPDEAGTPGWNKVQTPGPDEVASGWKKDPDPADGDEA